MCINAENTFHQKHKYKYLGIHWKLRFIYSFLQKNYRTYDFCQI